MIRITRTVVGLVFGYALMVVLITLAQEVWLGGISWNGSSLGVLFVGGTLTCLAGGAGGLFASAIEGNSGRIASSIMALLVVTETAYLVAIGKLDGPLWFDVVAAGSLIAAILLGAELCVRLNRPSTLAANT